VGGQTEPTARRSTSIRRSPLGSFRDNEPLRLPPSTCLPGPTDFFCLDIGCGHQIFHHSIFSVKRLMESTPPVPHRRTSCACTNKPHLRICEQRRARDAPRTGGRLDGQQGVCTRPTSPSRCPPPPLSLPYALCGRQEDERAKKNRTGRHGGQKPQSGRKTNAEDVTISVQRRAWKACASRENTALPCTEQRTRFQLRIFAAARAHAPAIERIPVLARAVTYGLFNLHSYGLPGLPPHSTCSFLPQ